MQPKYSFEGLSLLREKDKEKRGPTEGDLKRQEYLKRYTAAGPTEERKKKKKKKPKTQGGLAAAVRIVDQDVSGFQGVQSKPAKPLYDDEEEEEDVPVVVNEDAGRILQQQLEKAKNYYGTDEDGSGWIAAQGEGDDASPPRRQRHDSPDVSPPRRARHDSADVSPPRRARHDSPDASPPRRARQDSPDASPPRRARHDTPDASPPRRAGHDTPDASPPRRPSARHDSPDASPPRRTRHDSPDASPPRRTRHDTPDASPPRRPRHASPDASPPRRQQHSGDVSPPRKRPAEGPPDNTDSRHEKAAKLMADGTRAGLVSREVAEAEAQKLKDEAAARRLRAQGRGEQTVVRDKATGRILTAAELAQREQEKKKKEQEEQHLEWKGGLAQKRAAEERLREMQSEAAKPFARHSMDESAEEALRERERWGDPMAHLVRKKRDPLEEHKDLTNKYDATTLKKSGFVVPQEIPPHSWIKRRLPAPHNRYGIKPGRHWDGVDRSNGREKQLMMTRNELRVREQQAYEWAVADM